jgi:hypothetical protein
MFVEREIRSLHLLHGLSARTMKAVVPMFDLLELPVAKCSIFEEGDPGDAFYILTSGSVAVQKGDPAITLAVLRSGGGRTYAGVEGGCFFGEMALIDGAARMARCGGLLSSDCTYCGSTYHDYTYYVLLTADYLLYQRAHAGSGEDARAARSQLPQLSRSRARLSAAAQEDPAGAQERPLYPG